MYKLPSLVGNRCARVLTLLLSGVLAGALQPAHAVVMGTANWHFDWSTFEITLIPHPGESLSLTVLNSRDEIFVNTGHSSPGLFEGDDDSDINVSGTGASALADGLAPFAVASGVRDDLSLFASAESLPSDRNFAGFHETTAHAEVFHTIFFKAVGRGIVRVGVQMWGDVTASDDDDDLLQAFAQTTALLSLTNCGSFSDFESPEFCDPQFVEPDSTTVLPFDRRMAGLSVESEAGPSHLEQMASFVFVALAFEHGEAAILSLGATADTAVVKQVVPVPGSLLLLSGACAALFGLRRTRPMSD
jgi:hypothetical protein